MTHLEQLKACFRAIGISFKEIQSDGYTLIITCHASEVHELAKPNERFIEFDPDGELASY